MSQTYSTRTCHICRKEISNSGGGIHHFRAHVRRGEAVEIKGLTGPLFTKPNVPSTGQITRIGNTYYPNGPRGL